MSKAFRYAIAYGMWFVDLGLSAWLFYVSRTALLTYLALFYEEGDFRYTKRADLTDNIFTLLLGLGWLALIVLTEGYYRAGARTENLMKRFARVTGPILMCIFLVDLILFGLQGFGGGDWLRWLILSAELVIGVTLILYNRKTVASSST
jgi:hypothetical protein